VEGLRAIKPCQHSTAIGAQFGAKFFKQMRIEKILLIAAAVLWAAVVHSVEWDKPVGVSTAREYLWVPVTLFGWAMCAAVWWLVFGQRR
jgi:hypothetical protein